MKHAIVSILAVVLLVFTTVALFSFAGSQAEAEPVKNAASNSSLVNCTDIRIDSKIVVKCTAGGIVVLNQSINLPAVTLPPITLPQETKTVRVPGPTQTVTQTETATSSPPISTPTATVTITEPAQPAETVTERPSQPRQTVTETARPEPRQGDTKTGTIEPAPEEDVVITIPEATLDIVEAAGVGTIAIVIVAGLILLGMYAGYYMGYKDSDKAEAKFYKSLLGK